MDIPNRLLRVVYSHAHRALFATDIRGCLHRFDDELNLLQSSAVTSYDSPTNAICVTDEYVFTKTRFGAICKWDADTLQPLDFHDGATVCDRRRLQDDEEPSPSPNRGIAVFNGRVYTNNAYNQMVVLDVESFEIVDIRESPSKTFFDCICADHTEVHVLSDVDGNLHFGNLETWEFPIRRKVDTNVVHGVVYDARHDRFWTTQDGGLGEDRCVRTGVTCIEKDGSGFREFKLSHEDNEFIAFDPEYRYLYAGGFNGRIFVFDNEEKDFCLKTVIGPLDFQVIHAAVASSDQIYALLQTGDLIRLNWAGEEVCRASFRNRCAWTFEPHPEDDTLVYVGTDQGVSLLRYGPGSYGSVQIEQIDRHVHGFGIVKDVRPLPDLSYVAISRKGYAFRADESGAVQWYRQVLGVPRGLALRGDAAACMVACDEGTVWELDVATGEPIDRIPVGSPSYACAYAPDGRRVVTADQDQRVCVYAADSHAILGEIGFEHRLKRMMRLSNGELFVVGPDGMFELDLERYTVRRTFGDYLVSTKENGVLCDGHLYVGGYGYQLATYRYEDGAIVDLEEHLPDYSKAFAAQVPEDGVPILLVGGRGGFVNAYRLHDGVPIKVREYHLR